MPAPKYPANAGTRRLFVPLRILGNLSLLVGTVLVSATAVVPGLQIAGTSLLMAAGVGMLGTYIGTNFLYGITNDVIKFTQVHLNERKALYEFWRSHKDPKPTWFQEKWARFRHIYLPACLQAVSDFSVQTQQALDESSLVSQNIAKLSEVSAKLARLSNILGNIEANTSPPRIESDEFRKAHVEFYDRLRGLGYHNFSEALEAEETEIAEINAKIKKLPAFAENQASIKQNAIKRLIFKIQHPTLQIISLTEAELRKIIEKNGSKRIFSLLKILGNTVLIIAAASAAAASLGFPILSAAIILNTALVGTLMVSTYVALNFGWDTIKSIKNIAKQYIYEKEPIFTLWCKDNSITRSIFSLRYLNARMQLIYLPATAQAFVDLLSSLKTAIFELTEEYLELSGMGAACRLTTLFSTVQEGWKKTFGLPPKLAEFQEKEKIFSALLADLRYNSFEEGVLARMKGPPECGKEEAQEYLLNKLQADAEAFKKKYSNQNNQDTQLANIHRRFRGYQRAIENEAQSIQKQNPTFTEKACKKEAIQAVNKRHPIEANFEFEAEQKQIIDLEKELADPLIDRQWVPLKTLGNLGLAAGIILGILSFSVPGLPIFVAPLLMGAGAALLLTYVGVNFKYDTFKAINHASKEHIEERVPYFDIWIEKEKKRGRQISGINYFFKRLLCTIIPAMKQAIDEISEQLDNSISSLMTEAKLHKNKEISKKAHSIEKKQTQLNRFDQIINDLTLDLLPADFRETEELINAFLKSKGYKSFEHGIIQEIEKMKSNGAHPNPDPEILRKEAKEKLTAEIFSEINTFDKKLQKLIDEKHLDKFEARKKLISPYHKQHKKLQKEEALTSSNALKPKRETTNDKPSAVQNPKRQQQQGG